MDCDERSSERAIERAIEVRARDLSFRLAAAVTGLWPRRMAGDDGDAFDRADAPGEDGVEEAPVAQGLGHKTISFFGAWGLEP